MKRVLTLLLIFSVGSSYAAQETVKAIIWPLIDPSNPEESNKAPLYSVDRSDELDQLLHRSQEMLKQKNIPDNVRAKTVTNMTAIQIVRKDFSGNPCMALLGIKNDSSLPPLISAIAQYNLGVYHDVCGQHPMAQHYYNGAQKKANSLLDCSEDIKKLFSFTSSSSEPADQAASK